MDSQNVQSKAASSPFPSCLLLSRRAGMIIKSKRKRETYQGKNNSIIIEQMDKKGVRIEYQNTPNMKKKKPDATTVGGRVCFQALLLSAPPQQGGVKKDL